MKEFTVEGLKKLRKEMKGRTCPILKLEGRGFGVKAYPSGVLSFYYTYKDGDKKRFMTLGVWEDEISLQEAREKATDARKKRRLGTDPIEVRKATKLEEARMKTEEATAKTVNSLIKEFLKEHCSKLKDEGAEYKRFLIKEVSPLWGDRKVDSITDEDVKALVKGIMNRPPRLTPVMANRALAYISRMFNYAIYDACPCMLKTKVNPAYRLKKPGGKEKERERVLSEKEISHLWGKLIDPKPTPPLIMSDGMKRALLLTLVTGQRPGEVIGTHRDEIDGHWLTIPGDMTDGKGGIIRGRSKTGITHKVYLTDLALELIGDGQGYIFPSPHDAEKPICEKAMGHACRYNIEGLSNGKVRKRRKSQLKQAEAKGLNRLGMAKWTPHDLRRTVATMLGEMGYEDQFIDMVQNHAKPGMAKIYVKARYLNKRKELLEGWEAKLREIINVPSAPTAKPTTPANVIPITRKAA